MVDCINFFARNSMLTMNDPKLKYFLYHKDRARAKLGELEKHHRNNACLCHQWFSSRGNKNMCVEDVESMVQLENQIYEDIGIAENLKAILDVGMKINERIKEAEEQIEDIIGDYKELDGYDVRELGRKRWEMTTDYCMDPKISSQVWEKLSGQIRRQTSIEHGSVKGRPLFRRRSI